MCRMVLVCFSRKYSPYYWGFKSPKIFRNGQQHINGFSFLLVQTSSCVTTAYQYTCCCPGRWCVFWGWEFPRLDVCLQRRVSFLNSIETLESIYLMYGRQHSPILATGLHGIETHENHNSVQHNDNYWLHTAECYSEKDTQIRSNIRSRRKNETSILKIYWKLCRHASAAADQ